MAKMNLGQFSVIKETDKVGSDKKNRYLKYMTRPKLPIFDYLFGLLWVASLTNKLTAQQ